MNRKTLTQPNDPYDTAAWLAFYSENPGFRRSVGAEGVNDDPDADPDPDPNADPDADPDPDPNADPKTAAKSKPTDSEAKLLKELMKHKNSAKDAAAKLAAYDGVDVEEYRRLKTAAQETQTRELEAKGAYEQVKTQMIEAHKTERAADAATIAEKDQTIATLQTQINELTVGTAFANSKFLIEKTVLTPSKARVIYGAHFELEDGKVVAYTKPKGAADRAPLVDGSGLSLGFEAAIEKILDTDPDKESLLRASLKAGAGSTGSSGAGGKKTTSDGSQRKLTGADMIGAGLETFLKANPLGAGKL